MKINKKHTKLYELLLRFLNYFTINSNGAAINQQNLKYIDGYRPVIFFTFRDKRFAP